MVDIRFPVTPSKILNYFTSLDYKKYFYAYYSTKPNNVLSRVIEEAVRCTLPPHSVFALSNFVEENNVLSPEMQTHFVDGQCVMKASRESRPMLGSYLLFAVPLPDHENENSSDIPQKIEFCAAISSLFHGEFVANELHFSGFCDLILNNTTVFSPSLYVRQSFEQESLNQEIANILVQVRQREFLISTTVLSLIHRSHHERDSSIKFLFMWLALEAVLGKGHSRRHFAIDIMKSEKLNCIMNELRRKRDALLHDGQMLTLDHLEYLRIKVIVIMGLTQSRELRRRLLSHLEHRLSKSTS